MKKFKLLGLAVISALALTALVGASSASGSVICTENKNPCPYAEDYAAGTSVHAVLEEGEHVTFNLVWTDITCETSTIQGKTANTGGSGETVRVSIEDFKLENCACGGGSAGNLHVTELVAGELEIHHKAESDDATLTGKNTVLTFNCTPLGTQCRWGTGSGIELGTVTGGNPATLDGDAEILWSSGSNDEGSFLCGSSGEMEAAYEITSPKPLHIAASATAAPPVGGVLCTENKSPCPEGEDYALSTTVHAVVEAEEHALINGVWTDVTCENSTIMGKTENTGSSEVKVKVPVQSLTFGECSCSGGVVGTAHVTTLETGSLEIQRISGTDDGTLTGKSQVITFNCTSLGTQCRFGSKSEGTDLGTVTGGNPATLDGSATLVWSSGTGDEGTFICGSTAWEAAYEITSPKPLHIAES